mgnify:CR=1 FL=1
MMVNNFLKKIKVKTRMNSMGDSVRKQVILLIVLFLTMCILRPSMFLTINNLQAMTYQFPEYGLIALGVMFAMIAGGIDLSLVGVANLSAIVCAKILITCAETGMSEPAIAGIIVLCVPVCMIIGTLCGVLNGYLISVLKVPAMLATLGTMQVFAGLGMIITKGKAITGVPEIYVRIGSGKILGFIPTPLCIYIIAVLVCSFLMSKSTYGLRLRMMGTSNKASEFAGQDNRVIITKAHIMGGILASFSGLIMLARMNSARPDFGSSYTMQSILIVVPGGVLPAGGFGTVRGVVLATLILQCFSSGLNMFPSINPYLKQLAWGLTLLMVMIISVHSGSFKKFKWKKA